jgi:hypothetical protein
MQLIACPVCPAVQLPSFVEYLVPGPLAIFHPRCILVESPYTRELLWFRAIL